MIYGGFVSHVRPRLTRTTPRDRYVPPLRSSYVPPRHIAAGSKQPSFSLSLWRSPLSVPLSLSLSPFLLKIAEERRIRSLAAEKRANRARDCGEGEPFWQRAAAGRKSSRSRAFDRRLLFLFSFSSFLLPLFLPLQPHPFSTHRSSTSRRPRPCTACP